MCCSLKNEAKLVGGSKCTRPHINRENQLRSKLLSNDQLSPANPIWTGSIGKLSLTLFDREWVWFRLNLFQLFQSYFSLIGS